METRDCILTNVVLSGARRLSNTRNFQHNRRKYRRNYVRKQKGRIKLRPYLKKIFKKPLKTFNYETSNR